MGEAGGGNDRQLTNKAAAAGPRSSKGGERCYTHSTVAGLHVAHENLRQVEQTDHVGLEHDVDVLGRDVCRQLGLDSKSRRGTHHQRARDRGPGQRC